MVTALRPRPFADSLCMEPAHNLDELRVKAAKFMRLEELWRGHGKTEPHNERARMREKPVSFPPLTRPKEARTTRFSSYTPLNANRGQILEEALNADLLPTLRKAATPQNVDTSKHYQFH